MEYRSSIGHCTHYLLLYSGIDKLIDPLRVTIQSKAKANSVKQEFEKQDELKRSAMRAIAALLTITDSGMCVCVLCILHNYAYQLCFPPDKCPALVDFVSQIKATADTAQLFESIQADAALAFTASSGPAGIESMDLS